MISGSLEGACSDGMLISERVCVCVDTPSHTHIHHRAGIHSTWNQL